MNKYLVIYKLIRSHYDYEEHKNIYDETIENDIMLSAKCDENFLKKIYENHSCIDEETIILNIIKLDD